MNRFRLNNMYLQMMNPITASNRNSTAQIAPPIIPALSSWGVVLVSAQEFIGIYALAFSEISPTRIFGGVERLLVLAETLTS